MWSSTWVDTLRLVVMQHHVHAPDKITEARACRALAFIDLLPAAQLEQPRLVLSQEGEIALMWESGEKCLVVVPEEGQVRYVAQFGSVERKGTVGFSVGIPYPVRDILNQGFARRDS